MTQNKLGWRSVAIMMAVLSCVGGAIAEVRTWSDASGKFKVEAEFVSSKDGKVVLRRADGKEITVPLSRLNDDDRKFVKEQAANAEKSTPATDGIRDIAQKFYKDLRTKERTEACSTLTDAAQAIVKDGKSALPALPTPDEAATAIKAGKVKLDGQVAEVPVQVRVGGKMQKTTLHFRNEADGWRVFAISAKLGDDEKTISFETAMAPPEEPQDPLVALVGKPIELEGITIEGKPLDMAEYKGKVVLIDFWATWCGPCRAEIPNIFANWQKYHGAGFEVIAISTDQDMVELQKFVMEEKPPWTVVADNHPRNKKSMSDKYGISGIPAFILIGKDGNVAAVHCRGERLGQQLAKLLGGVAAISN
jgi:thiol-disulfide isomerase/thioredoxin